MGRDLSASSGTAAAWWETLRSDRWARAMLAAFAVSVALYLLPVLGAGGRALLSRALGPLIFLALVVGALVSGLDRLQAGERRFWQDVAAAFSALWIVAGLYLVFPGVTKPLALDLVVEALYAMYYAALMLAAERQPHRAYRWRPAGLERTLAWPAVIGFITALFGYFIAIPILASSPATERWMSSYALYLALDAYLTARFMWLSRDAGSARWKTLYRALALTNGAAFAGDLLELSVYRAAPAMWGAALDLVYYLPYLAIVLARSRHLRFGDEATPVVEERPETHYTRPSGRTMIHALIFPIIHIGGYSLGVFDAVHRSEREIIVFWAVLALGTLGVVQHRVLETRARALWRDREEVEASLRRNEKDLRMMVERYHTDQKLRMSEEKLAKAFRACPDAMVIASFDGCIKEVNDSFELLSGYCREDILGKMVMELGLWDDPDERQDMIRTLEIEGSIRDRQTRFRTRSGQVLICLLSVERLTIDGEPHLLSVTHDITERKRIEEKLKTQAVLLDKARDAIAVLDLEDRVTYWNRGAERLYGWSTSEAIGRRAGELLDGELGHQALDASKRVDERGDWIGEMRQLTKDGAEVVVESWWTLVRDSEGKPHSKLIVSSDITSRGAEMS